MHLYFIIWLFCSNRFFLLVRLACIHSLINEFKVKPLHNYNEFVLPFPLDMKLQTKQWWVTHHKSMHFDNIFSNLACGLFEFYVHKLPKVLKEGEKGDEPSNLVGFCIICDMGKVRMRLLVSYSLFFFLPILFWVNKRIFMGILQAYQRGIWIIMNFPITPILLLPTKSNFFFHLLCLSFFCLFIRETSAIPTTLDLNPIYLKTPFHYCRCSLHKSRKLHLPCYFSKSIEPMTFISLLGGFNLNK